MNIVFWASMLGMLFVAIGILILPLIRVKTSASIAYKESNLGLYESKVKELKLDLEEGRIDKEHYMSAINELDHELLLDVPVEDKESAAMHYGSKAKPRPVVAMIISVFLPALVLFIYMQMGMHENFESEVAQQDVQSEQQASISQMIKALADKLDKVGGSAEEWAMLGRSYKHIQRYADSSNAFSKAIELEPSARLYLEQAEALALSNEKSFVGEPRELVMKALELAPDSINTIWFAGVAEFQSGNYGESIDLLIQLSAEANADPEIGESIRFYVTAAREKLVAQGQDIPSVEVLLNVQEPAVEPVAGVRLEVAVDIKNEIRELFEQDTVVFVYAKAKQGPKMPLAAQRISLGDLPATVFLDDSMAMVAGMNISAFDGVVVSARISRAGSALAQSGDYIGAVVVDDVSTAKKLEVLISDAVR